MNDDSSVIEQAYFDADQRYRIIGTLGAGNFGIVYKAYDEKWREHVALKTSRDDSFEQQQWLKEEYRVQSDIVHPIFVQPDELRKEGERFYFTMKLVDDARSFTEYFRLRRESVMGNDTDFIAEICAAAAELADGLQTIHSFGRFHGDIKPENVLISNTGEVALLDFGLMRSSRDPHAHQISDTSLVGTPTYLPPEQYDATGISKASDWYALAVMLYEAICGEPAFKGDPLEILIAKQMSVPKIRELLPTVPKSLGALVDSMLDPDPSKRPAASEVARVLHDCANPIDTQRKDDVWLSNVAYLDDAFIAREDELSQLIDAYAETINGATRLVEVVGPSGIGKSALIRNFLDSHINPDRTLVLEGRCLPNEDIPYKAFDAIVDELTNYWLSLSDDDARSLLPGTDVSSLGALFPELRRVRVFDALTGEVARSGDPRTLRLAGFRALNEIFLNIAWQQPLIIWIDDIQWADQDSAALFENLFSDLSKAPILFLFSRRPDSELDDNEFLTVIDKLSETRRARIVLTPLAPGHCRTLVESILDEKSVSPGVIEHIIEQGAGLPYLLSELAHFAKRQGDKFTVSQAERYGRSLLVERLNTLTVEDSVLVELAALATVPLSPQVILAAAESVQRYRIRDLCGLRLLRAVTRGNRQTLQIYHDHLREFVVANMSSTTSIKRHASLLSVMEENGGFEHEAMLPHAIAAKNDKRTRHHALKAAVRAKDSFAFEQAAEFYRTALATYRQGHERAEIIIDYADALANAGRSTLAAPTYDRAYRKLRQQDERATQDHGELQRKAGEQYLKSGHFAEGLQILEQFLTERGIHLPRSGRAALLISSFRRARLYTRGFKFKPAQEPSDAIKKSARLDYLWAATTSLSMMDPVRADSIGLLHFSEALDAGDTAHIARSLGYEAAFAALIGGTYLRGKANRLLALNASLLDEHMTPYEHAFYQLGLGAAAFFHSDWSAAVKHCDIARDKFRGQCIGAEYEAAVAVVFSLQALGLAGDIAELDRRLPAAIQDADERGDLFAANNYRGGFHAIGRIARGQLDLVQADLQKVVETWTPGFYQMHAYHRVFAGVNADLYLGNPHSALARIDDDWGELKRGLFLTMELPAIELRWARARACLAVAKVSPPAKAKKLVTRVKRICRFIRYSSVAAASPHVHSISAGVAALSGDYVNLVAHLRAALTGYTNAGMTIHREVARWLLLEHLTGEEYSLMEAQSSTWQKENQVPEMQRLADALAPACRTLKTAVKTG